MHLQNLLVISNPLVFKMLKLAVFLCSYEKFSTGKVNTMDFSFLSVNTMLHVHVRTVSILQESKRGSVLFIHTYMYMYLYLKVARMYIDAWILVRKTFCDANFFLFTRVQ